MELLKSWARAWSGIGARASGKQVFDELLARYSEPHRRYHSLQHLTECITTFEPVRDLAAHPDEVEIALWFHDAIYETRRHDNEEQSASWARSALLDAGVPREAAQRVYSLVMATRHTALPTLPDEQLLVDIDLSILGADAQRFAEYEQQIRDEYSFVPRWMFRRKRRAILRSFLERPGIFSTAHFRAALEDRARGNVRRAITT